MDTNDVQPDSRPTTQSADHPDGAVPSYPPLPSAEEIDAYLTSSHLRDRDGMAT
jgi:hypothetical protein